MAEYGFVYVLSNDSMPWLFKIGCTEKHPIARARILSSNTACPTPFILEAFFQTYDYKNIEREIHDELSYCRVNERREFFKAHPLNIVSKLEMLCPDNSKIKNIEDFKKKAEAIFSQDLDYWKNNVGITST